MRLQTRFLRSSPCSHACRAIPNSQPNAQSASWPLPTDLNLQHLGPEHNLDTTKRTLWDSVWYSHGGGDRRAPRFRVGELVDAGGVLVAHRSELEPELGQRAPLNMPLGRYFSS
jgi:hypothetical protein